jgi:hypothetical protein
VCLRLLTAEIREVAATASNHKKTQKIYSFALMTPKAKIAVCVDKNVLEQEVFLFAVANDLPLASVSATSFKK